MLDIHYLVLIMRIAKVSLLTVPTHKLSVPAFLINAEINWCFFLAQFTSRRFLDQRVQFLVLELLEVDFHG